MNNTHQMMLVTTHPSGAEEWTCQVCGRRIIIGAHQLLKIVMLNVGDITVFHSGGKGGLTIGEVRVEQGRPNPLALSWTLAPENEDDVRQPRSESAKRGWKTRKHKYGPSGR